MLYTYIYLQKDLYMKTITLDFDLYRIYDRLLDGCSAKVEIEYDLNNMFKNSINADNLKLISVTIDEDFIKKGPFDIPEIIESVKQYLSDFASLSEVFTEEMSEDEWSKIEHHFA